MRLRSRLDPHECGVSPISSFLELGDINSKSNVADGCFMPVLVIPKSWVQDPRFHSMPSTTPTKGSMGLLSCSDLGGSLLTEFEIPKSWVSDLVSVTTTSPTMGSMELLSNGSDSFTDPFEGFDGAGAGAVCSDIWILTTGGQPSGSHLPANYIDTDSSDAHALKVHDANDAGNVDDGVADVKDIYIAISGGLSSDLQGGVMSCSGPVRSDSSVHHKTPIRSVSGVVREMLGFSRGDARSGKPSWVEGVSRGTATADAISDAAVITELVFPLYRAVSAALFARECSDLGWKELHDRPITWPCTEVVHYEFQHALFLFCLKLGTNRMSIDFLTRKKRT